jgi:L-ornithine N5-oxygenase
VQREYDLMGSNRLRLATFSEVASVGAAPSGGHRLALRDINNGTGQPVDVDAVVLATGFRDFGSGPDDERHHPLLAGVLDRLVLDDTGVPVVNRDYSLATRPGPADGPSPLLYLNGLCEASHGMGDAGALAMLSVRSTDIVESLMRHATSTPDAPGLPVEAGR